MKTPNLPHLLQIRADFVLALVMVPLTDDQQFELAHNVAVTVANSYDAPDEAETIIEPYLVREVEIHQRLVRSLCLVEMM